MNVAMSVDEYYKHIYGRVCNNHSDYMAFAVAYAEYILSIQKK